MNARLSLPLVAGLCAVSTFMLPAAVAGTTVVQTSGRFAANSLVPAGTVFLPPTTVQVSTGLGGGTIFLSRAAAPTATPAVPPVAIGNNVFLASQAAGSVTVAAPAAPGPGLPGSFLATTGAAAWLPTGEIETVTYLGVETSRVTPAMAAQLSLPPGTGLVVTSVDAGSPAAAVLKPYDVLLKLDDQQLIVQVQLSVLVRNRAAGDEVALHYIRAGRPATVKVKLGQHEVPKIPALPEELALSGGMIGFTPAPGMGIAVGNGPTTAIAGHAEADRVLAGIPHGPGEDPMPRMQIENRGAPGLHAVAVDPANSQLVYHDETGSVELTIKDGRKTIIAKDLKGAVLFTGPATTPDERNAIPAAVRTNLDRMESMQNSSFRTDGQFLGNEPRIVLPGARSI